MGRTAAGAAGAAGSWPLAALADMGVYSTDDLGWLGGWGGERLLAWEEVGLAEVGVLASEPCVVDHVEYWLAKEAAHIRASEARLRQMLPPMNEAELQQLHQGVCEARWAAAAHGRRRRRTVCAGVRFADVLAGYRR
jgi:hypothetical protein